MTVFRTNDMDYIKSVLSSPGMAKLCSAGLECPNVEDVVADNSMRVFFGVEDFGTRLGFISFDVLENDEAIIHVALKTRGTKTLEAISKAISSMIDSGTHRIFAVYPVGKRSLDSIASALGFKDEALLNHEGVIFSVKTLTI